MNANGSLLDFWHDCKSQLNNRIRGHLHSKRFAAIAGLFFVAVAIVAIALAQPGQAEASSSCGLNSIGMVLVSRNDDGNVTVKVNINIVDNSTAKLDWGDGTKEYFSQSWSGEKSHHFNPVGGYTIKLTLGLCSCKVEVQYPTATPRPTNTPRPTSTPTNTALPTNTPTDTPIPPTATNIPTEVSPTPTETLPVATITPTDTPNSPTATVIPTEVSPTPTESTPVPTATQEEPFSCMAEAHIRGLKGGQQIGEWIANQQGEIDIWSEEGFDLSLPDLGGSWKMTYIKDGKTIDLGASAPVHVDKCLQIRLDLVPSPTPEPSKTPMPAVCESLRIVEHPDGGLLIVTKATAGAPIFVWMKYEENWLIGSGNVLEDGTFTVKVNDPPNGALFEAYVGNMACAETYFGKLPTSTPVPQNTPEPQPSPSPDPQQPREETSSSVRAEVQPECPQCVQPQQPCNNCCPPWYFWVTIALLAVSLAILALVAALWILMKIGRWLLWALLAVIMFLLLAVFVLVLLPLALFAPWFFVLILVILAWVSYTRWLPFLRRRKTPAKSFLKEVADS